MSDEAIRDHLRSLPWPVEAIEPGWYQEHRATFERNRAAVLAARRRRLRPHNEGALSYPISSLLFRFPSAAKQKPKRLTVEY